MQHTSWHILPCTLNSNTKQQLRRLENKRWAMIAYLMAFPMVAIPSCRWSTIKSFKMSFFLRLHLLFLVFFVPFGDSSYIFLPSTFGFSIPWGNSSDQPFSNIANCLCVVRMSEETISQTLRRTNSVASAIKRDRTLTGWISLRASGRSAKQTMVAFATPPNTAIIIEETRKPVKNPTLQSVV